MFTGFNGPGEGVNERVQSGMQRLKRMKRRMQADKCLNEKVSKAALRPAVI